MPSSKTKASRRWTL